ncbi:hypothetical protein B0G83_12611 [Paraburkholderia sp. BL21I4N1]|nr:hypothetical protein B0G83_12611 [Paraburkholderia sp. BL21I4N1]
MRSERIVDQRAMRFPGEALKPAEPEKVVGESKR